jgi:hypothetical protein
MILHETERDPYGVLTLGLMHDMRTLADGFVQGWEAHRVHVNEWFPHHFWEAVNRPARYADVRDFIHTYADFPPTMVQAVALWMTREEGNVDGFWLAFPNVL